MTVTVCTALDQPLKKYEGCDAMVEQGTLHVVRRTQEPSEHYQNTTYTKIQDVAYYAPGAWLVCSFEEDPK